MTAPKQRKGTAQATQDLSGHCLKKYGNALVKKDIK